MAFARTHSETYRLYRRQLIDYAALFSVTAGRARTSSRRLSSGYGVLAREIGEPVGNLRRIVRNLARDWLRRHAGETRLFDLNADIGEASNERPSLEEELTQREPLRIFEAAPAELPERPGLALDTQRFEGLNLREIAARLSIGFTLPLLVGMETSCSACRAVETRR